MKTSIETIRARQILDCKARPVLEVDVITRGGCQGRAAAPTGTSVGMYEAFILRDGDESEYEGLGVHSAVRMVEDVITPALQGMDVCDQEKIDLRMIALDGTKDKHKLGGNSIYSVSAACMRAAAACAGQPVYRYLAGHELKTIPLPTFNVVNGGDNRGIRQAFNEFILAPYKAESVDEAVAMAVQVYRRLEKVIRHYCKNAEPFLGGSYGWAAPSKDPETVLNLMQEAVEQCGYTGRMAYCLDCASSEMYDKESGTYELNGSRVKSEELIQYMKMLTEKFPLLFVEDLLDENDWDGFERAHKVLTRTNLIGDDFIVTNRERLEEACNRQAIDGFILKPNQVGTLTEAMDTYRFAEQKGLLTIPSGRSGGVVGDIVADLSLGLETPISKNGAPKSGERLDKMNSLLRASSENPGSRPADLSRLIRF